MNTPVYYDTVEACVAEVIQRVGNTIILGIPLGLGKPNPFVNALYRRAKQDSAIQLTIMTALSLEKPCGASELEQRFLGPLVERIFGDYPDLDYMIDLRRGDCPANIQLKEFYFKPGAFINNPNQQQNYICCNYTDVARVFVDSGVNVIAQMVSAKTIAGVRHFSLSSNPDVTLDLLVLLNEKRRQGQTIVYVAQTNNNMPFMYHDAVVEPATFDLIIDSPAYDFTLFGPPNMPVDCVDYLIGLNASALVKDGGSLQIGIGSLGDALVYGCQLRHRHNAIYRSLLDDLALVPNYASLINTVGGGAPFEQGLYGCSEMLVNGFWRLYQDGVLKRRVYNDVQLQRLLNEGRISEQATPAMLTTLVEEGVIHTRLTPADFHFLQRFGIFKAGLSYQDGVIVTAAGVTIPADLQTRRDAIVEHCLGDRLAGGVALHGGFFLGPQSLYDAFRTMDETTRQSFNMTAISYVNQLYGDETLKRLQRRRARFINTTMLVTLLGGAASDGLENGQVVSGVGGQYNFVAMANALPDARSILLLRSARRKAGVLYSNIVWNYGHITIPRHLRDIVVTEYGIADLRGKSDKDVIAALLNIADSRFQPALLEKAKQAGKIPSDYVIPEGCRNNLPERLQAVFNRYRQQGYFPAFPFGADLTDIEITLGKVLNKLKAELASAVGILKNLVKVMERTAVPESAKPYLARLQLDQPFTIKEQVIQKLLINELIKGGYIDPGQHC